MIQTTGIPSTGTLVTTTATQTLTGKTVNGSVNTVVPTNATVGAAQIIDYSIPLATKATTLSGLTLPDAKTNTFPMRLYFAMKNVPADTVLQPLHKLGGEDQAPTMLVSQTDMIFTKAVVEVNTCLLADGENTHHHPAYTAWGNGSITLELSYSKSGTNPFQSVQTIASEIRRSDVDGWRGRWTRYQEFPLESSMGTGNEIGVRVSTTSDFDGTELALMVTIHGKYNNMS